MLALLLTVHLTAPPCSFVPPPGYESMGPRPDGLLFYQRSGGPDPADKLFFSVEVLDKPIGREPIGEAGMKKLADRVPPGMSMKLGHAQWGEFDLETFETQMTQDGLEMFSIVAQVPVSPVSVQLTVGGARTFEPQVRSDLALLLASFEAKSNWLTQTQRADAATTGLSKLSGFLGVLAVVGFGVVGLVAWLFTRKKPSLLP